MARYIVATRRELKGLVDSAYIASRHIKGVIVDERIDLDRIFITSDLTLAELQSAFGGDYHVEEAQNYQPQS